MAELDSAMRMPEEMLPPPSAYRFHPECIPLLSLSSEPGVYGIGPADVRGRIGIYSEGSEGTPGILPVHEAEQTPFYWLVSSPRAVVRCLLFCAIFMLATSILKSRTRRSLPATSGRATLYPSLLRLQLSLVLYVRLDSLEYRLLESPGQG